MTTPEPNPMISLRRQHAVEDALHQLKYAILDQANHELTRVDEELRQAGIDHPTGAAGVRDLAGHYSTATHALIEAMQEELDGEPEARRATPHYAGMLAMLDFAKEYTKYDE